MNAILDSFDTIDKSAPQPLYQQIKNTIHGKIKSNEWQVGQKLPSENELVAALQVSRMTIHRALRELTQEGLIDRVHGVGSFVADAPKHASLIELRDIAIEVTQSGKQHSSRVLALDTRKADEAIARNMQVALGTSLYFLNAVHYQDDIPIQLEARYVSPKLAPNFLNQDFCTMTSTSFLLSLFRPQEMEHIVRAIMPDERERTALRIESGEPCLQLSRRTWKQNQVVTHVTLTYPSSRYDLGARYSVNDFQMRQ